MNKIDPITLSTVWHYMQQVCREMRYTMERTATNSLATSLHDLAYGIWDADTRVIAIPEGFPCRLISSTFPIRAVLRDFGKDIHPGDVFLTNSPHVAGAVHLPDWVFVKPIFYKKELLFFSCMGTHVPDNGGAQPGTHFLAKDSIAEGLNIPPVKIMEKGKMRNDVLELILANNRLPDMMRRETRSLIGSTNLAERRMVELLDKYGKETVYACIDEMIARTEQAVRAKVATWPEGVYKAMAQTDDDGTGNQEVVTVRCTLTIKGGEATFDFSESDPQVAGCINAVYPMTQSDTLCTVFLFLGSELAAYHNEGSLAPFHVIADEGTVVSARPGALTAQTPGVTGALVIEAVCSALSQALPDRAIASYARTPGPGQRVGTDPRNNELYVYTTFNPLAGAGAVSGYDGYQCCCDFGTLGVVSKADVEEEMVRYPWHTTMYEFTRDSAGPGKWRGAPGIRFESTNEGSDGVTIGGTSGGWRVQGQGQQGGCPSPFNSCHFVRNGEIIPIKDPRGVNQVKTGDTAVSLGSGGAGVGRPEERDPEAVSQDVRDELVSVEAARDVYKVALKPGTFEVDEAATRKMRGG